MNGNDANKRPTAINRAFGTIANKIASEAGRPLAFMTALVIVIVWGATGPIFLYSDTWQLVINTGTTIITFLMVFLIQNSQNRDSAATQVKLDELIRVSAAKNFFVGIEHLTDDEIERLRDLVEKRTKNLRVRTTEMKAEKATERTD